MFKPRNIYQVLRPMYCVTKIIGLAPFSLKKGCYKKSKIQLIWCLISIFVLNSYIAISLHNRNYKKKQLISKAADIIDSYLGEAGVLLGVLLGCLFVNHLLEVLELIQKFDNRIGIDFRFDIDLEYRKSKIYLISSILVVVCFLSLLIISVGFVTLKKTDKPFGEFLSCIFPAIINTSIVFHFCALNFCLKQRFGWLNKILMENSKNLQADPQKFKHLIKSTKNHWK